MDRRKFIAICSSIGATTLAGCSVFSGPNQDTPNENTPDNGTPSEEIPLPHDSLERGDIPEEFLSNHFDFLSNERQFRVERVQTEQSNRIRTVWDRQNTEGFSITRVNGTAVEEKYYGENLLGIRDPTQGTVTITERLIPTIRNWADGQFLRDTINNAAVSLDSQTEDEVIYAGILAESDRPIAIAISKSNPVIRAVRFQESEDLYSIGNIGEQTAPRPTWFDNALEEKVIATTGIFQNGNAIIIETNEKGQSIPSGSVISIVRPDGQSANLTVESEIQAGDNIYIVFRGGTGLYDVNQLPPVSDRDDLPTGTYVILANAPNGDQLFQLQPVNEAES